MESNPKEIRLKNDIISDLPDSILCKILSYLPTKNAVAASILSTSWKNISPFDFPPIELVLDDSSLLHPTENNSNSPFSSFIDFVDRLLNETLSDVPCVESMVLYCEKDYGDAQIVSWVCAALRLSVQHLDLKFSLIESETLFHSLNGCKTLVTLQLLIESELCLPDDFSLPNLEVLHLTKLIFNDENKDPPINQLLDGCPALEYLHLLQCDMQCFDDMCIRCPLLKVLFIGGCWTESSCGGLTLDVPNLEALAYIDSIPSICSVRFLKSLNTAHIDLDPTQEQLDDLEDDDETIPYYDSVAMIVKGCSSTIRLYLSSSVNYCLHLSSMQLPVFQNLTWLSLGCLGLQWALLARLLWNAPNLEQLVLEEGFAESEGGYANFKDLLRVQPECLEYHLKRIEFWVFKGDEDEMKLVAYFLKNGEVLQNLILHCLPPDDISILTKLLMLPRQSKTCQIECRRK